MNFELQRAVMAFRGQAKVGEKEDGTPIYKDLLNPYEWAVLMAFTNFARKDDPLCEIYPGIDLLMKTTHMSRRQVFNVLNSLEEKKFIARTDLHGHTRAYKFLNETLSFSTEKLKAKALKPQPPKEEPLPDYDAGYQPAPTAPDGENQQTETIAERRARRR